MFSESNSEAELLLKDTEFNQHIQKVNTHIWTGATQTSSYWIMDVECQSHD